MEHLNYEDRLKALDIYFFERRKERYIIIYVWKILEGLVPNIEGNQIRTKLNKSSRNGWSCNIPKLVARQGEVLTLREHSFPFRGPRLFNAKRAKKSYKSFPRYLQEEARPLASHGA